MKANGGVGYGVSSGVVGHLNIASVRTTVGTGVQNAADHVPPINLFVDLHLTNNEVSR